MASSKVRKGTPGKRRSRFGREGAGRLTPELPLLGELLLVLVRVGKCHAWHKEHHADDHDHPKQNRAPRAPERDDQHDDRDWDDERRQQHPSECSTLGWPLILL